jgi:hypothetical protein
MILSGIALPFSAEVNVNHWATRNLKYTDRHTTIQTSRELMDDIVIVSLFIVMQQQCREFV